MSIDTSLLRLLNLTFERSYLETDLDEMEIRHLIISNKRNLRLTYFDENRTPNSFFIVIDGLTTDNEQYRLTLSIKNKGIYRNIEITACGSGIIDKLKARLFHQNDILYSMEASRCAQEVISDMLQQDKQQYNYREVTKMLGFILFVVLFIIAMIILYQPMNDIIQWSRRERLKHEEKLRQLQEEIHDLTMSDICTRKK